MSTRLVIYLILAISLAACTLLLSWYAYSPFSDEAHYGRGSVYVGPTHK